MGIICGPGSFAVLGSFACIVPWSSIGLASILHNVLETIYEFPVKKEPDPPSPWGRSWMQDARTRAARSAVIFNENSKSSVSAGEESHSDPLRVTTEARSRLSTPAKAAISGERKVQVNPAKKGEMSAPQPIQM